MIKTAFVTGASRGIGKRIALTLGKLGYQVALVARSHQDLKKVAEEIMQQGSASDPFVYALDVSDEKAITLAIEQTYEKTHSLDILVNAAGILLHGTSEIASPDLRRLIDVNLLGTFYAIQAAQKYMKKQRSGYIFNIASRAGKFGIGALGGYCTSKFGLMGLNDSLCSELAQFGIKITALCPGFVDTEMASHARVAKEDRIPVKDISKTIEFLLSTSSQCCIREIILECRKTVESSNVSPFVNL